MTETKLTWHHPLCEGECFACLIERTIKKEYGEVGLRYLLKQINDAPVHQAEQEPVGRWNWNEAKFEWLTKFDYYKHHMTPLYAAPVRTKDLTDDEIEAIHGCPPAEWVRRFARAVIAADREKNK